MASKNYRGFALVAQETPFSWLVCANVCNVRGSSNTGLYWF